LTLSNAYAGQRLTAAELQAVAPMAAYKPASQSVTSSVTPVNDDALLLPDLLADAVYHFRCSLVYNGGTLGSSDIRLVWAYPSGAQMTYSAVGMTTGGVATPGYAFTQTGTVELGTNGTSTPVSAVLEGTIAMSSTPGALQLQFAQHVSSATATTIQSGSDLLAWQVQ
jgi:hypothetical protein